MPRPFLTVLCCILPGAEPDAVDCRGVTPLLAACEHVQTEAAQASLVSLRDRTRPSGSETCFSPRAALPTPRPPLAPTHPKAQPRTQYAQAQTVEKGETAVPVSPEGVGVDTPTPRRQYLPDRRSSAPAPPSTPSTWRPTAACTRSPAATPSTPRGRRRRSPACWRSRGGRGSGRAARGRPRSRSGSAAARGEGASRSRSKDARFAQAWSRPTGAGRRRWSPSPRRA